VSTPVPRPTEYISRAPSLCPTQQGLKLVQILRQALKFGRRARGDTADLLSRVLDCVQQPVLSRRYRSTDKFFRRFLTLPLSL